MSNSFGFGGSNCSLIIGRPDERRHVPQRLDRRRRPAGPRPARLAHGQAVLAGREAHLPAPSVLPAPMVLPPNERRRASRVVRVALASGLAALEQAGADPSGVAVFAASTADGHNCHALCETLASSDQRVSPTRFHNSLHNTPAGYWSIATGAMAASQSLAPTTPALRPACSKPWCRSTPPPPPAC
jgi:3-oxoacyl-(acyl-carrier-protein) synthase